MPKRCCAVCAPIKGAGKNAKMRSARDLENRLKRERPAAAQKTNETSEPAPAQYRERVQDRRVAYNIQDRVDPFGIAFAGTRLQITGFQQNVARAEPPPASRRETHCRVDLGVADRTS
jgi:hypothetical protein